MLARRLARHDVAPLAVAVSGGSDSVALLHLTNRWALTNGRSLVVLHVDHGLNTDSARWKDSVKALADRLGLRFLATRWTGPVPENGLPEAARQARHERLADMARSIGARVILTGHTADDVAESDWMRAEGANLGRMLEWSPSPVWPEGRGQMLLRPLLNERRTDLQDWLMQQGEAWIDDPANRDDRYARSRARKALVTRPATYVPLQNTRPDASDLTMNCWGIAAAPRDLSRRDLAHALVVTGGGSRLPRGKRLDRLFDRISAGEVFEATLAGARVVASTDEVTLVREAGEYRRHGLPVLSLEPGDEAVWDGRFAFGTDQSGWTVRPLAGLQAQLCSHDRTRIQALPAAARPSLPVLIRDGGTGPVLAHRDVMMDALGPARLAAALGQIVQEANLKCRREWRTDGSAPIL